MEIVYDTVSTDKAYRVGNTILNTEVDLDRELFDRQLFLIISNHGKFSLINLSTNELVDTKDTLKALEEANPLTEYDSLVDTKITVTKKYLS